MAKKRSEVAERARERRDVFGRCPVHEVGVGRFDGLRHGLGVRRWSCGCAVKEVE